MAAYSDTCRQAYCEGDGNIELDEGEVGYYEMRGLSMPLACKACIAWRKGQSSVQVICRNCGRSQQFSRNSIIMHHKKIGEWIEPALCAPCEKNKSDAARTNIKTKATDMIGKYYTGRAQHPRAYLLDKPQANGSGHPSPRSVARATKYFNGWTNAIAASDPKPRFGSSDPALGAKHLQSVSAVAGLTPLEIRADPSWYFQQPDNTWRHLESSGHHIINHADDLHIQGSDAEKLKQMIQLAKPIASSLDPSQVAEFRDSTSGRLIKYEISSQLVVILNDKFSPPSIRTVYEADRGMAYVGGKMASASWVTNVIQ